MHNAHTHALATAACTAHLQPREAVQLPLHIMPPLVQLVATEHSVGWMFVNWGELGGIEIDAERLQALCCGRSKWYGGRQSVAVVGQVQAAGKSAKQRRVVQQRT